MSHRRPTGPVTPGTGSRRSVPGRPARSLRAALLGVVAGVALIGSTVPAVAAPPPPNPTDSQLGAARTTQQAAATEVGRLSGLLAGAEAELERVGIQAEAAGVAYEAALEAFQLAQAAADQAAAELQAAAEAVAAAEARIAHFSRDTYMKGSALASSVALLDSEGPGELIQRAAILDYVAENQIDVLGALEVARARQANADSQARAARDESASAEDAAQAAKRTADSQLAVQQASYQQVSAQKAQYEQQLQAAQIQLLQLQGARNAYAQWEAQKRAEEAAAIAEAQRAAAAAAAASRGPSSGGGGSVGQVISGHAKPTSGRVSSCFGWRWGALHGGVDIAAPIGTPVYAASSGVVRRAGAATGFGLAVYLEGDDGEVTVYGHVNRYFVSAGERVSAGEQIAEVGNRGQSTGPHLHFEVHPGGAMHGGQVNPVPWLNARGIYLGGCGG
ncbi:M23 family metallopeptidase [Blastococcus sp. LR1]|uniref:M23 family metallopeptidase n=1 Tax=Blastococcus sp. LR1 TaxID=2877000 RepID=UPI001CC9495C|nr:M23 family metallopeptidase [Blastococcus sp. LR1]MCA0145866.1 M23 family metallopeptidase [Blastococcus sp. LR1]